MDWEKYKNKFEYGTTGSPEREQYNRENSRIHEDFYNDALRETGLTGHPKAGKAYSQAWESGHSAGFPEVFCHLQDLARLLLED